MAAESAMTSAMSSAMTSVLALAVAGLVLSVALERFIQPQPRWNRPLRAWQVHAGLWCAPYGALVLLTGRPWCSMTGVSAVLVTLVLVSNAKRRSLREPFIFQDYEYFLDTLRHPRLFLPFLGVSSFLLAAAFFLLAVAGFMLETVPERRMAWNGQLGGALLMLGLGLTLLWNALRHPLPVTFHPERDVRRLGLLASLWSYAVAERSLPAAASPFAWMRGASHLMLPHLVAVQSESFFDPRPLHQGIRADVLGRFDAMRAESLGYGALSVPAWGANTVRTEFAFLTGMGERELGVHRFTPYRAVTRHWTVPSLPQFAKNMGYRTLCIHPYWASFYSRDRVARKLSFDSFVDIREFNGARRFGPYVADAEVGERIAQELHQAREPLFIFAITMENHGPLHLEKLGEGDIPALYEVPPPQGCDDLTVYLRHLRNADNMLGSLRSALEDLASPAALCWYGDHVPIMPAVYKTLGTPRGEVPYLWWGNQTLRTRGDDAPAGRPLAASALAPEWLRALGLTRR